MITSHYRAYNDAVIVVNLKDRFICFAARFDALCEQSFRAKRRVFVFIVFSAVYFELLGGLFSSGFVTYTASAFMFDTVCFIGAMLAVYLSGCTVFAGAVCLISLIPFAFLKGYQSAALLTAPISHGVLPYFVFAVYSSALLFIYCVSAALSVFYSSYSALGVREMLAFGRFRNYSIKFALLLATAFGVSYAMYNYLF